VEGYVDPEIDNAVYEAKYLRASAILKEILLNDESPIFSRPRRFAFAETNVIDV